MASNFHNADFEDSSWQIDVQKNLSILTKSLNDLDSVLIKLLEHNLISHNEAEIIRLQETATTKNWKLLYTLKAKGWSRIKSKFMQTLKETHNDYCVHIIESSSIQPSHSSSQSQPKKEDHSSNETVKRLIKSKSWPEKKILPNSFYERKTEKEVFTHKFKNLFTQNENENKTTVINQKVAVSGLGGIGKTALAKRFVRQYENDYESTLWIDCGKNDYEFELMKLLKERKFREALELSRLMHDTLSNLTSRYNYGMCLKYNSDERKSIEIFESLFVELRENCNNASKDESYYKGYFNQFGIIQDRNKELTLEVVGGQLFLFYANEGMELKVRNYIFSEVSQIILPITALNDVIYSLNRLTLTKYCLSSDHGKNYVSLSIDVQKITTIFELSSCEVDENTKLPTGLQELNLRDVKVVGWKKINWSLNKLNLSEVHIFEQTQMTVFEMKIEKASLDIFVLPHSIQKLELYDCNVIYPPKNETSSDLHPQLPDLQQLKLYDVKMRENDGNELINFDISHLLPQSLHKLEINCETSRPLLVSMESIKSISSLHMWNCHLQFCKEIILCPKELTLFNLQIIDEQKKFIENILINNFVDFRQMEKLKLCKMSVDLNQPVAIREVTLRYVQVEDWINAKWTVNKLSIVPDQKKTGIRIVKNFEDEKFNTTASLKEAPKSQDGGTNNLQVRLNESKKVLKHTHDIDFQVSLLQILEIIKVLEDYTALEKDWTRILIGLRLSGKSIGELENLKCNFGKLILETLRSWLRERTTNATFDAFVKVIEKHTRHALAAGELRKNKEMIRMTEFD